MSEQEYGFDPSRIKIDIVDVGKDSNGVYRPESDIPKTPQEKIEDSKRKIEDLRGIGNHPTETPKILYAEIGKDGQTNFISPDTQKSPFEAINADSNNQNNQKTEVRSPKQMFQDAMRDAPARRQK